MWVILFSSYCNICMSGILCSFEITEIILSYNIFASSIRPTFPHALIIEFIVIVVGFKSAAIISWKNLKYNIFFVQNIIDPHTFVLK